MANELDTERASVESVEKEPTAVEPQLESQEEKLPEDSIETLPEWAQKEIKKLRKESATRRVAKNESEAVLAQQQEILQQILAAAQAFAPQAEGTSEVEEVASLDMSSAEGLKRLTDVVNQMSRDNVIMRVAMELDVPVEVVTSLRGDTYDDLKANALKMTSYAQEQKTATVSEEPKKVTKNTPAKAPSGTQAVGVTNAQRLDKYFGAGMGRNPGLFSGGGVVNNSLEE